MLKTINLPNGRRFKFGRKHSLALGPMLSFGNYLLKKFPKAPPNADYTAAARFYLRNVYGNSDCGDCTLAGLYHCIATFLANAGRPVPFTADDVTNVYKRLSGWNGIEDDPSDTGLNCADVLNYAQSNGLLPDGHKIFGWVAIDGFDQAEVEAAIWLFDCIYIAVDMPEEWVARIDDLKDGDTLDVAGRGNPENGHCIMAAKYDATGVFIDTWGLNVRLTWPALAKYGGSNGGEVYCLLDRDMLDIATEKAPTGVNWTQLLSDFQSIGA